MIPGSNPQEIFDNYFKTSKELMDGFQIGEGKEILGELSSSWKLLGDQLAGTDVKHWIEIAQHVQQTQLELWNQMLSGGGMGVFPQVYKPARGDFRFKSEEWDANPVFNFLKQSYLMYSDMLMQGVDKVDASEEQKDKLRFTTKYFIDAMSPTNFAAMNPDVLKEAVETKGQSLIDGLNNLMEDMNKGRISMTDETAFKLGENIATTEGSVIFENEMMQLIQYKPKTETVNSKPMLIVPPCINKFYILDLSPKNSFVRYCVEQGNTVFLISWINPNKEQQNIKWDDYIERGTLTAVDIIKNVTGAEAINAVAWCVGGTLLATTLAVLHELGRQDDIATATFFTTMLDFSDPGEIGVFIDDLLLEPKQLEVKERGVLKGRDLATAFSMLRANDLIWSYVVNNYLRGKTPPPFDILYWNSDATNLPATMWLFYIDQMYKQNKLREPGGLTICNQSIDLSKIKTPSYFLSTIDDHIAPWISTYQSTDLFSGPLEFVLGASGHIAGVINPPEKKKRNFWINGEHGSGPAHWLESAESVPGSWWPHWDAWIKSHGDEQIAAPKKPGKGKYKEIEPAPGRYVMQRI